MCWGRHCHQHQQFFTLLTVLLALAPAQPSPIYPTPTGVYVNDLIGYSEAVQYDPVPVPAATATSGRHRRHAQNSTSPAQPLSLSFSALHRNFTLELREDNSVFTEDVVFDTPSGHLDISNVRLYSGQVAGEVGSRVQGLVTSDGRFDGTIESGGEVYYVEPASRYGAQSPRVHTIIYRSSDVKPGPWAGMPCASQELHSRRRRRRESDPVTQLTESSVLKTYIHTGSDVAVRRRPSSLPSTTKTPPMVNSLNRPRIVSTPACDTQLLPNGTLKHVNKRATVDPNKTTCMLYLQADHLFFQKYGTEEACIEVMTRHVQRVNLIYRNTDFNQDGRADNISFMIKRIKVHTVDKSNEPGYRFPGNYGVEKFLELFSEEDYDAFCLAYMFTYRDFEMGTLGLAWTGDLKNAGGVCEKNGHYRGSLKSLNTGIVTLLNYGKHVPPAVSHVTLAHEIGHNFGSPHDPEMCTPGGEDGNYIMFARATSGDKKNNNKFSPCSLNSINPVLNNKARNHIGCFTEPQVAICGNGVVEAGEECDCGWEEDCHDTCCYPQRRYPPSGEPPCRLTPNSVCSPSQGPCCTVKCQLKFGDKCRDDNGCRDSSFCDGRAAACPASVNKPNKTICNEEFVCFMGECTGSICLAYGLESCQCLPTAIDPPTKACELCCKRPGDDQLCLSSFEWNDAPYDVPDMYSKPGTPCSDYNGYCDVFQKCREVDPSGPLATLRKLLLSDQTVTSVKKWLADHWYAVLVIVSTALILLMLSTKLLGRQSDSKLKSITIIHSATTETVRLPPEGDPNVTIHPQAVRSKLPLHRKVREKKLHSKVVSRRKKKTSKPDGDEVKPSKDPNSSPEKRKSSRMHAQQKSKETKQRRREGKPSERSPNDTLPPTPATAEPPTPIYENVADAKVSAGKIISSRLKRSNRVSTEVADNSNKVKSRHSKEGADVSPSKRRKRKKEEVPGHVSVRQKNAAAATETEGVSLPIPTVDPVGKVHSWLQQSVLPKSKSSPVDLSKSSRAVQPPPQPQLPSPVKTTQQPRSRSAGNLRKEAAKDKVKLQVLYRPPFKLSLKLRNSVGSVRTRVVPTVPGSRPSGGGRPAVLVTPVDDIDSNVHTVPSDLDVLLSESEFLFSDA